MKNIVLPKDQKWCIGYEGKYAASYAGEIWSYCKKRALRIKGAIIYDKTRGVFTYKVFTLSENGKQKSKYFHRMIAEAWLPNPENKAQVNHKDHNKLNNHVTNLEWVTPSENMAAMYEFGDNRENMKIARLKSRGLSPKIPLKS